MIYRITLILFTSILIASCTKQTKQKELAVIEDRDVSEVSNNATPTGQTKAHDDRDVDAQIYGADTDEKTRFQPLSEPEKRPSEQLIYFEYNSARVSSEYRAIIEAHANYLIANPNIHITLEGHADERGSREYNLALGEYRAQAIKRYMILLGVTTDQIRAVSYGEERPAVDGQDEQAWSQNRRVEVRY